MSSHPGDLLWDHYSLLPGFETEWLANAASDFSADALPYLATARSVLRRVRARSATEPTKALDAAKFLNKLMRDGGARLKDFVKIHEDVGVAENLEEALFAGCWDGTAEVMERGRKRREHYLQDQVQKLSQFEGEIGWLSEDDVFPSLKEQKTAVEKKEGTLPASSIHVEANNPHQGNVSCMKAWFAGVIATMRRRGNAGTIGYHAHSTDARAFVGNARRQGAEIEGEVQEHSGRATSEG